MATPVFTCGFECGALRNGHIADNLNTPTFSTTTFRSGLRALRTNTSASTQNAIVTVSAANELTMVQRIYINFTSLPSADCSLLAHGTTTPPSGPNVRFQSSDSKLYAAVGTTLGASGVSVTTGQWYRVDFKSVISGAGNDTADVQVDGSACGQASAAGVAAGSGATLIGVLTSCTADVFFDDWIISLTAADYPIGAGYVKSYIPNADGSHNVAGANDFERSATGTDITNATTDAYTLIDDRPLPTTAVDFINGIAPPNATDYVEWQYQDSMEDAAPRAVEAILAVHDADTAGANAITVTLRDHVGATSADIFAGDTGSATVVAKQACFATIPGGGAWTHDAFNALRSRFLVSDAAPDPYIDAAMLEAEFAGAIPAIQGVGSTPFTAANGTSVAALAKPTGGPIGDTAVDDVAVLWLYIENGGSSLTVVPASTDDTWTLVHDLPQTGSAPDYTLHVWISKLANATSTVGITWGGGSFWRDAGLLVFRGVHGTTQQDTTATENAAGAAGTTVTATGLSTASANAKLVMVAGAFDTTTKSSWSSPLLEIEDQGENGAVAAGTQAAAGSSGNKTMTLSASSWWTAIMLALRPSTSSVGGNISVTPANATLTTATFAPKLDLSLTPANASLTLTTFAPSVVIGTIVTPATASLATATFAPTVTATAHVTVTPTTAALTTTTFAPVLPQLVTPANATLTTTTFVPALDLKLTPANATLATATFAPTVSFTAHVTVTPTTATLATELFAPTVTTTTGTTVIPATGSLATATFAPTVTATQNVFLTPDTATLTTTTFAPTVTGGGSVTVTPDPATLTTSLFAPKLDLKLTPANATLATTAFAPTLDLKLTPTTASLATATFAPTVTATANVVVTPAPASLTLTTFAPNLGNNVAATPTTGALTLTTFAPTVTATNHQLVTPAPAALVLTALAPLVLTPQVFTPATAALILTTFAPGVDNGEASLRFLDLTARWEGITKTGRYAPTLEAGASYEPTISATVRWE